MRISYGLINHRHGTDIFVAQTTATLNKKIRGFCDEYWEDEIDSLPQPAADVPDEDVIDQYFETATHETMDTWLDVEVDE